MLRWHDGMMTRFERLWTYLARIHAEEHQLLLSEGLVNYRLTKDQSASGL
jgi:hypothetical protein